MDFQNDIPPIPFLKFKDHFVQVFDQNLKQDATENCPYSELVGEPLRLELNFTFSLEHVTELIALGKRISLVTVGEFGVVGKKNQNG